MFILDALNTRKSSTTKHSPYAAVFGQKPNTLNNIDIGDSNCPMEESVKRLLLVADTVQSIVPSDHNENNPSYITSNSHNAINLSQNLNHKNFVRVQNQYKAHLVT